MKIGYARVSTNDQNLDLQIDALKSAGSERIYSDEISGSTTSRPEFNKMLEALRPGDVLTIWKLDRIGRSLKHLIQIADDLQDKGIHLHIITQGIDTRAPAGKMLYQILGSIAEYEKSLIQERVQAGLKAAKARGRVGGRPSALSHEKQKQAVAMFHSKAMSAASLAKTFGVSKPTLYKYVNKHNERRQNIQVAS